MIVNTDNTIRGCIRRTVSIQTTFPQKHYLQRPFMYSAPIIKYSFSFEFEKGYVRAYVTCDNLEEKC